MLSTPPSLLFKAPNFNFNSYSDRAFHFSMGPDPAAKKILIQILHPAFKFKATAGLKLTRTKKRIIVRVDYTVGGTHL
jgi:hypothetical protein